MDSTLPHLQDSRGRLLDAQWTREADGERFMTTGLSYRTALRFE
jgi:hypothetical protein